MSRAIQFQTVQRCTRAAAARNLCTSFVALTSSRGQAVVYVRYTSIDITLPLYFFFCFFVPLLFLSYVTTFVVNKDFQKFRVKQYVLHITLYVRRVQLYMVAQKISYCK